jgi:Protein of unknown function (DUF1493)
MNDPRAAVSDFLKDYLGESEPLSDDADIFYDFKIDGDDAFDFIEKFAAKFEIDLSTYRWYFHHGEEGILSIGGLFFKPPYRRVVRMPLTPQVLAAAIRSKRWPLEYPLHSLPSVRWDMMINQMVVIAMMAWCAAALWQRFVG